MAALLHAPLARTIQFRTLTIACSSSSLETTTRVALPPVKNNKQDTPRVLLGMSEMDLQQLALQFNQEKYRGKQLHHLLYKRKIKKIQDFSQVPLAFRNELQEAGWSVGRSPIFKEVTAADGTVKLLIKLEDNLLVETVGIPVQDDKGSLRLTACVSSQVGCPLRCSFCATGKGGFSRNLKSHEIVEQVLAIEEMFKRRVTNVVFMGMGEPMLNMKQVVEAHRCLNKDIQIGQRMITISTVGVPNTIRKLATHKLQSTLALSLHAPNQQLREKIVPSAKSYPLDAIMNDCKNYFVETGRRVSFEYTLLAGINDTVDNAIELAELLHKWGPGYHVNLIPFNPIEGSEYKRPYRKSVLAFSGRRVLSMLNKRPAVPPPVEEGRAQLWARNVVLNGDNPLDEIPKPANVSSVHRFMLNLIHQNRKGEALHVFTRHLQTVISGIDDFAVALASKASLGHPNIGCQIHGFALVSGFMSYVSVSNSLMNMYCKSRDLRMALYILENSKNLDTVSYNTVLSGFEDNESALVFARGMHSAGIAFDAVTCTSVLAHCADCEEFDFGFQLHCLVSKFGLKAEVFIGNALVTLYSKCGRVMDADKVFCEMPHKDLVSWNAILSGYAQEGSYGVEAILGFIEMVRGDMKLDHVSFTSVISACGQEKNLDFGKQVHGLSMKRGYGNHVTICNVLMSLYAKCGIVVDAKMVFQNIVDRNVVSWTTMLSIDEENAVNLFKEMVRDEICPNLVTFVGLIHAIIEHNMVQEGLMVHAFCVKSNFFSEINVTNSFITMYGKFKLVEDFIKVFEELDYREIISWNSLISAYSLNGMFQEAIHVFLLASKEITPNPYTFGSVLHAVASSESISLRQGQRCHGYIRKLGLDVDPVVSGALLDMYAKRGSISESQKIFSEMTQKTEVSWTTIISAHSKHGDYEKVMKYFKEMVMEGVKPDSITFLSVLTSCGHNGMVDIGVGIFNSMLDDYSIEPSAEHYSCIVDMLGRAGRLNEAEELLGRIPGGPGISVLQSLLGACRIHGNVEMAVRVSDALIAMEPNDSGSYVLMSNLFAEKGKWENVAKLRRMMRDRKVTKEVGFSWADVGDSLHLHGFSSGDKTHPLSKEIYVMAELLGSEMKRRRAIIGDM